jgi:hypothetical protein
MNYQILHSYCNCSSPENENKQICIDPFCSLFSNMKTASWINGLTRNLDHSKIQTAEVKHFPFAIESLTAGVTQATVNTYFQTFTVASTIEVLRVKKDTKLTRYENWAPQGKEWTLDIDNYRFRPTDFISVFDFAKLYSGNKSRLFNWSWRTGFHFTLFSREKSVQVSHIAGDLENLFDEFAKTFTTNPSALGILRKGLLAGYTSGMESQLELKF